MEWNLGPRANADYLMWLIQAVTDAGYEPGVYANYDSWERIFESADYVVDSDVPLWVSPLPVSPPKAIASDIDEYKFAHYNDQKDTTIQLPFGGWDTAVGHQYSGPENSISPNGEFDLSVFEIEVPQPSYTPPTWVTYTTPSPTPTYVPSPPTTTDEPAPPEPTYSRPGETPSDANMSEEGIELLKLLEGFRANYYWLFGEKHIG